MPNNFSRILITLILLAGCFAFFDLTETDLWLQDRLYNFNEHHWLVRSDARLPRLIFYTGPKWVMGITAAFTLLWLVIPSRWRAKKLELPCPKRRLWLALLCAAAVPLTIGAMKSKSDIYCPWAITRYGGEVPYFHFFDPLPPGLAPDCGQCFPAGHASGGFALLGLYYLSDRPRNRWIGLMIGLGCGWIMGLYQMLRGAHFLSHTIVTMLIAALIAQILARLFKVDPPPPAQTAK